MISKRKVAILSVLFAGTVGAAAQAEDIKLGFQLVTHRIDAKVVEASDVEGHILGSGEFKGVAVFDDGRIADKVFVLNFDEVNGVGTSKGYSTYRFVDGSSIIASFVDIYDEATDNGTYTVLGGTGQYESAKGTGWFERADEPWDGASLFKGGFDLTLP